MLPDQDARVTRLAYTLELYAVISGLVLFFVADFVDVDADGVLEENKHDLRRLQRLKLAMRHRKLPFSRLRGSYHDQSGRSRAPVQPLGLEFIQIVFGTFCGLIAFALKLADQTDGIVLYGSLTIIALFFPYVLSRLAGTSSRSIPWSNGISGFGSKTRSHPYICSRTSGSDRAGRTRRRCWSSTSRRCPRTSGRSRWAKRERRDFQTSRRQTLVSYVHTPHHETHHETYHRRTRASRRPPNAPEKRIRRPVAAAAVTHNFYKVGENLEALGEETFRPTSTSLENASGSLSLSTGASTR